MTGSFFFRGSKGRSEWWWYLLTLLFVITGIAGFGRIPWLLALGRKGFSPEEYMAMPADEQNRLFTNNENLLYNLFPFLVGFAMLLIAARVIHRRKAIGFFTSRSRPDAGRFFAAFLLWGAIQGTLFAIGYFRHPEMVQWNYDPQHFFPLLLICILLVPVQTGFEELLCRGFVLQWTGGATWKGLPLGNATRRLLAQATSRGIVAAALNGVVFGGLHAFNPEMTKLGWFAMAFYMISGFFAAFLTVMDDGIGLSWGYHTANNFMGLLIVSTPWQVLRTDSLFLDTSEPSVGIEYVVTLLCYPLMIFLLARLYRWKNWKERLFAPQKSTAVDTEGR